MKLTFQDLYGILTGFKTLLNALQSQTSVVEEKVIDIATNDNMLDEDVIHQNTLLDLSSNVPKSPKSKSKNKQALKKNTVIADVGVLPPLDLLDPIKPRKER